MIAKATKIPTNNQRSVGCTRCQVAGLNPGGLIVSGSGASLVTTTLALRVAGSGFLCSASKNSCSSVSAASVLASLWFSALSADKPWLAADVVSSRSLSSAFSA